VHRHSCATHAMVLVSVAVTPQLKDKEGKGEICCYTGHSSRNKSNETASEKIGNAESSRPREKHHRQFQSSLFSRQRNSHNLQLHVKPYKSTIQTLHEIRTNVLMASHHYLEEQVCLLYKPLTRFFLHILPSLSSFFIFFF